MVLLWLRSIRWNKVDHIAYVVNHRAQLVVALHYLRQYLALLPLVLMRNDQPIRVDNKAVTLILNLQARDQFLHVVNDQVERDNILSGAQRPAYRDDDRPRLNGPTRSLLSHLLDALG